ncbi:MAG: histidine phosphatase family protein [Phycisphaerales bacterium]
MIVCIIRHGKAKRDSASGSDVDRALRRRGIRQAEFLSRALCERLPSPCVVYSSPFTRARQTAEPIAAALGAELRFDQRLEVGRPASHALELITENGAHHKAICLVGHHPQLAELIAVLTQGPTAAAEHLRTGEASLCTLDDWTQPIGQGCEIGRLRLDEHIEPPAMNGH